VKRDRKRSSALKERKEKQSAGVAQSHDEVRNRQNLNRGNELAKKRQKSLQEEGLPKVSPGGGRKKTTSGRLSQNARKKASQATA